LKLKRDEIDRENNTVFSTIGLFLFTKDKETKIMKNNIIISRFTNLIFVILFIIITITTMITIATIITTVTIIIIKIIILS
jgi:hypothetical protein